MEILSFLDLPPPVCSPGWGMADGVDGNQAGCHGQAAGTAQASIYVIYFPTKHSWVGGERGVGGLFSSHQQKPKAPNGISNGIYYSCCHSMGDMLYFQLLAWQRWNKVH